MIAQFQNLLLQPGASLWIVTLGVVLGQLLEIALGDFPAVLLLFGLLLLQRPNWSLFVTASVLGVLQVNLRGAEEIPLRGYHRVALEVVGRPSASYRPGAAG